MNRAAKSVLGMTAIAWPILAACGCTPRIKAVEAPGQTILRKGKAVLIEREGLSVILTPLSVHLEGDELLAGMQIELINQSDRPVRLDWRDVVLVGGDEFKRPPMDPKAFKRYAELAQGDPPRPYPPRDTVVSVGVGVGGWHYGPGPGYHYGPPYYYDPYYYDPVEDYYRRRERIARFVSALWRSETVDPGFAARGYVVFDYEVRRKDRLRVGLTLNRVTTTRPATAPTSRPLQPTAPGPLTLWFHFET